MKRILCLLLIVATATAILATSTLAQNDRKRNKAEKAGDRKELRQDARATRDDILDLVRLEELRAELDRVGAAGDVEGLKRIDQKMMRVLAGERSESNREMAEAKKEVKKSKREVRSDRREIRENRREGASKREKRDDRKDLRDDKRDLRDDKRDAAAEKAQKEKVMKISAAYKNLKGSYDAVSIQKRASLMDELIQITRTETSRNKAETREDRRELREDRRESREDKRQK